VTRRTKKKMKRKIKMIVLRKEGKTIDGVSKEQLEKSIAEAKKLIREMKNKRNRY